MAFFRILLLVFGATVAVLVVRFAISGERRFLRWAGRLIGIALVSGFVFFAGLLLTRLI